MRAAFARLTALLACGLLLFALFAASFFAVGAVLFAAAVVFCPVLVFALVEAVPAEAGLLDDELEDCAVTGCTIRSMERMATRQRAGWQKARVEWSTDFIIPLYADLAAGCV